MRYRVALSLRQQERHKLAFVLFVVQFRFLHLHRFLHGRKYCNNHCFHFLLPRLNKKRLRRYASFRESHTGALLRVFPPHMANPMPRLSAIKFSNMRILEFLPTQTPPPSLLAIRHPRTVASAPLRHEIPWEEFIYSSILTSTGIVFPRHVCYFRRVFSNRNPK